MRYENNERFYFQNEFLQTEYEKQNSSSPKNRRYYLRVCFDDKYCGVYRLNSKTKKR